MKVKVSKRFEDYLPHTTTATDEELKSLLEKEGQREPITVWKETGEIVDGHRRHRLLRELRKPAEYVERSFDSDDEVYRWMERNQMARRNLGQDEFVANAVKRRIAQGVPRATAIEEVAAIARVSERTVYRALKSDEVGKKLSKDAKNKLTAKGAGRNTLAQAAELPEETQQEVVDAVEQGEEPAEAVARASDNLSPDEKEAKQVKRWRNECIAHIDKVRNIAWDYFNTRDEEPEAMERELLDLRKRIEEWE